jgi:hypothetical protein
MPIAFLAEGLSGTTEKFGVGLLRVETCPRRRGLDAVCWNIDGNIKFVEVGQSSCLGAPSVPVRVSVRWVLVCCFDERIAPAAPIEAASALELVLVDLCIRNLVPVRVARWIKRNQPFLGISRGRQVSLFFVRVKQAMEPLVASVFKVIYNSSLEEFNGLGICRW